jgi:ribonuclease J
MQIIIHRGTHEIGGSCVEIENKETRIVIDIGMPIVTEDGKRFDIQNYKDLSGQEMVDKKILPDIKGFYSWDTTNKKIDALLISHAHSDHYGFYNYLREDIQYFLGEGTRRIIDFDSLIFGSKKVIGKYTIFQHGDSLHIGSFTAKPFLMDHSAFDAYAFLIESEGKKILYSGDFREHGRKGSVFQRFLKTAPENVDALLLEGTVIGQQDKKTKTETEVERDIIKISQETLGMVLVIQSTHNVDRIVSFYKAAIKANRVFLVDVYTANFLNILNGLAKIPDPLSGFDKVKVFYPYYLTDRLSRGNKEKLLYRFKPYKISKAEISANPGNFIMMVRPTMILDLSHIEGLDGATVIYSMWHGYLEDNRMKRFQDYMHTRNMSMIQLHTGGHANIDTLKKAVDRLKPKVIIPIHTFYPEQYRNIFSNVQTLSDGKEINI